MSFRLLAILLAYGIVAHADPDPLARFRRGLYRSPKVDTPATDDSPRIRSLLRAGNLYLSLHDAIALAVENNLDVAVQRLNTPIAQTETLRAKGGATLRGITTNVLETPAGIGGPGAPLLTAAANGFSQQSNLPAYSSDLTILAEPQTNSSVLSPTLQAIGPAIPVFDPVILGTVNAQHTSTPETNILVAGSPNLVQRSVLANIGYQQGFSTGTQIDGQFNNNFLNTNSNRTNYNPYTASNLTLTVTQPLLRGFGVALNRRFITIARNNERVSDLVFKQQLISTVSGVIRLYQDLVALTEDVRVKRETLALAQKLYEDNKNKVEVGTLAPVEETRAQAQVAAARQDLVNAQGFVQQQELILKSVLTRRFTADPAIRSARIVVTDSLEEPATDATPAIDELLKSANANRPDLLYSGLQVENAGLYLKGSRNLLKPEVDLVGIAQNSALAGSLNNQYVPVGGSVTPDGAAFEGNYGDVLSQLGRRSYPTYGIGVNLTLPLRNRAAEADVIRDELQFRQSELKRLQLANQVRLEVEDALVALDRSRQAYEAAAETRKLQEQSLEIEQERLAVGLSTTYFVLQYQSYVAQARSTEIAAKSTYAKAKTALDRATGLTLDKNGISVSEALLGRLSR